MNSLTVSYRFSRAELSTLLQAMQIGALPGAPLKPVAPETAEGILKQLSDEGMTMVIDGVLYIDKLVDCLLRTAADSKSCVVVTDAKTTAVLWKTDRLVLLGSFPEYGECALTPLQDENDAQDALAELIQHMSRPLHGANASVPERQFSIASDSQSSEREIAVAAMALL